MLPCLMMQMTVIVVHVVETYIPCGETHRVRRGIRDRFGTNLTSMTVRSDSEGHGLEARKEEGFFSMTVWSHIHIYIREELRLHCSSYSRK